MKTNILVVGAGGHCRVILSILDLYEKYNIIGIADREEKKIGEKILSSEIKYTWNDFTKIFEKGTSDVVIAIGDNSERKEIFNMLKAIGYRINTLIHPSALIEKTSYIGEGTTICMGAKISAKSKIGDNSIINSGAIIDHETIIGNNCHIGPGVNISGRVKINDNSFIGLGATIIDKIEIGKNVIVGAGSVVINNLKNNSKVVGIPAKEIMG